MPPRTATKYSDLDLSGPFRIWCKKNGVTPTHLHRSTGWTYQYCSDLLRGRQKFGYHSFGLFVCSFGLEALEEILRLGKVSLPMPEEA